MGRVWTEQQRAVLEGRGKMVVSASAGSGKTAVMIEKIKNLIVQGGKVEEILALTFTRASAHEMKERLQLALQTEIMQAESEEMQLHLQTELEEIESATITTIDAFCNNLVKKNFFRLDGVVPNFSILTEEDDWLHKLQNRAMHSALQEWLAMREEQSSIDEFCKIYAKNANFSQLAELVLQGYNKVRNRAAYKDFIANMPKLYTIEKFDELLLLHFHNCKMRLEKLYKHCKKLYDDFCQFALSEKFYAYILNFENFCKGCMLAENYEKLVAFVKENNFDRLPTFRPAKDADFLYIENVKAKIEELKTVVIAIKKEADEILFYQDRERSVANFMQAGKLTAVFCKLILIFDRYFTEQKVAAGKLEFIDLSHLANQLLLDENLRQELQMQYKYLFVDEYQDTSPIQESILQKLNIENFCMVGDLKQSIYGFRGCTPEIMQQKMQDSDNYKLYQLSQNFRSKHSIIHFVNGIFQNILPYYEPMQSNIEADCPKGVYSYSYLDRAEEEQDCSKVYSVLDNLTTTIEVTQEAELTYAIIQEYIERTAREMGGSPQDYYRDIVLLTRSRNENLENIIAFLTDRGIPITTDADSNICQYPEIQELCNILQFIDNRSQDIPLVATLKSGCIGMTDEELVLIRKRTEEGAFYMACSRYAEQYNDEITAKLKKLDKLADALQTMAKLKSCSTILEYLLVDKGLELYFLASGGKNAVKYATNQQKLLRIRRLLEAASGYSVSAFLQKLKLQGGEILLKHSSGQNAVQIMTVHQSKGLEFPVVILVGLENKLAHNEKVDKFKYDSQYGFYFDAFNTTTFTREKTILSRLARDVQVEKAVEDQKRIFYVAMTRAKKEMHILVKKKEKGRQLADTYDQFSDFFVGSDIEKLDRTAEVVIARGAAFAQSKEQEEMQRLLPFRELSEQEQAEYGKYYQKVYAYQAACQLPLKSSATALKALQTVDIEENRVNKLFAGGESVLAGLAYHAFLEHVNLHAIDRESEIDRVLQLLPKDYQERIKREKVIQILSLPIFANLKGATLLKEKAFLLYAKASEIELLHSELTDGILLQGIIDLLAIEKECIKIIDYKYSGRQIDVLAKEYRHQMQIYKLAVEKWQPDKKVECHLLNIKSGACIQIEV